MQEKSAASTATAAAVLTENDAARQSQQRNITARAAMKSGQKHDGRSPDYDDWTLNGDLLYWDDLLECAFELSSMGIRVDPVSLDKQLTISGCDDRRERTYHKMLLNGELPLTIGGGIGQSRLSMLLLGKAHIGEVQSSVWDAETIQACKAAGVILL